MENMSILDGTAEAENWVYRGEGAMNVVLVYKGSRSTYVRMDRVSCIALPSPRNDDIQSIFVSKVLDRNFDDLFSRNRSFCLLKCTCAPQNT